MKNKKEYIAEESNIRLDKYIAMKDNDFSRSMIQKLIDEGQILVNGKTSKSSYRISKEDKITIEIKEPKQTELKAEDIKLDIIYEDNDIIVVNKQKGLVVHPGNGNPDGTLVNAIMNICGDSLSGIGGEIRPRNST